MILVQRGEMMAKTKIEEFHQALRKTREEIGKVIVGQETIIDDLLTALLCNGHALLEGLPGLGKTLLVRTLGTVFSLKYSRIQFTPDLMPADLTGTNILQSNANHERYFVFKKGPLFAQIILADEINRATAKTQSALLEAMQEQSITVAGETYQLESPFFVLATQNPLELEGTYPLPEAQLDRFFFKLDVGLPNRQELNEILARTTGAATPEVSPTMSATELLAVQQLIRQVPIAAEVMDYAARLILATHPQTSGVDPQVAQYIRYGASPRGAQALVLGAKARAFLTGRYYAGFEELRAVALPALRHRIILNFEGEASGLQPDDLIRQLLATVPELV